MVKQNDENATVIKLLNEVKSLVENVPNLKYYRNKDLKRIFGFSDNTIINYRDYNILPYTKIGDIYFYPVNEIKMLLNKSGNFEYFKN
ncbi:DNA-binding protein [Flavobacterium sp.]|mgnify:CR=1 FL=1|uniref:DNA-binding protein n=1 Tax=Flavobacterium sp. TaxID=239 RepID=UPI0025E89553|nr:DNA-binding protein [Flavobacterium sp.]